MRARAFAENPHFTEEFLYVCARADLLRQGVENVEGERVRLYLVVLETENHTTESWFSS